MARIAQTELLCVYCPHDVRAALQTALQRFHPKAVHSQHHKGWLTVEVPLGAPASRFVGSSSNVRFLLGEEGVVRDPADTDAIQRLVALLDEPQKLARLPGDFSFVVLGDAGHVTVVRSCAGTPRLFGFCHRGVTAVSTRLDWLAWVYPDELRFNRMRLLIDLSALAIAPDHSSLIDGIATVPCGHLARWGTWRSPRVTRYWSLPERIELTSAQTIAEAMEPELRAELRRHVDADTNVAVLLSGGLDSSLLFGLVARETTRLDAVTTLLPKTHPDFARERYYSQLAATGCRQQAEFTFTPQAVIQRLRQHPGDLCPLGMEWFGLSQLQAAPDVVVSGWFADECWGFLRLAECLKDWFPRLDRLLLHAPFKRDLFRHWFNRHRSGRFTFPPANAPYPEYFDQSLAPAFRGFLASVSWVPRPEGVAEKLRLHRWLTDMTAMYAEAASYVGARAVTPFTCRAVVELAAQCDPHALFHRGLSKVPLRLVAKGVLPHALVSRRDKGDWTPFDDRMNVPQASIAPIQALLDTRYLADHPSLPFDDVWSIEWLNVLERGKVKVEHERKSNWR